ELFSGIDPSSIFTFGSYTLLTVGDDLYTTDGTAAGTKKMFIPVGPANATAVNLHKFTRFGGDVFFLTAAKLPDGSFYSHFELFVTSGASGGTVHIANPLDDNVVGVGNSLYFASGSAFSNIL